MTTSAERDTRPEPLRSVRTIGGGLLSLSSGRLAVANGENVVTMAAADGSVRARMRPDQARKLADILRWQADAAEEEMPIPTAGAHKRDAALSASASHRFDVVQAVGSVARAHGWHPIKCASSDDEITLTVRPRGTP